MLIRSLILLGLCAAIGVSAPAYAETTPAKTYLFPLKSKAVEADTKDQKVDKNDKKKKLTAKEKAKQQKAVADAKVKAKEDRKLAGAKGKVQTVAAVPLADPSAIAMTGNNGELRSEAQDRPQGGFLSVLFGGDPSSPNMLPQTRALDAVLEQKQANKKFKVKSDFEPQSVEFSGYPRGTIVIDTRARYLYLMESSSTARRYAIAVGREGLEFKGTAKVGDKQEWPRWIPTLDMQKREPKKYGQYKDGMPGGPENPLGARAIYLYQGKSDTHIRIHGTNQPQTIGTNSSNGCFRMVNDHVMDLYRRVKMGTDVVVL
ncbi:MULTISPECIES: L,D-transpeptidase [unclassified Mesorhizobium]|uniref:L,D-transpeptidase n=1 Tax=unclassified Mesorhizobium TaxID=325217 RepID=UPI0030150940